MPGIFRYCTLLLMALPVSLAGQNSPPQPAHEGETVTLSNDAISAAWSVAGGSLRWQSLSNRFTGVTLPLDGNVFELVPREGAVLRSADLKIVTAPVLEKVSDIATSFQRRKVN
jgi:hypothetical protein